MKTEHISPKQILNYCACLFLLSWGLQLAAIFSTDGLDDPAMKWWLMATMVSPSVVTSFFLYFHPGIRSKFLWKPSWKLIYATLLAVLIPIVTAFSVVFIFKYFQWGTSQWFDFSNNETTISGGPFLLGLGTQSWIVFALNVFVTGLVFALLNSVLAAGEEVAWRGLLQGLLIERLGIFKGIILLGFLWSMWHLPIQLFGYNYPENPITGSFFLSPLLMIGYSIFMAWTTIYAKSFIPAAIAHGAGNGIQEGIIYHMNIYVPELYVYVTRAVVAVIISLVFVFSLAKMKRERLTR